MAGNVAPNIVDNGLVLYLDAANIKSYPTTGTTWTDLSRSGYNGTLTNGPTFNSSNGGSIVFDGVNDYINIGNIGDYTSISYTLEAFIYPNFDSSTFGKNFFSKLTDCSSGEFSFEYGRVTNKFTFVLRNDLILTSNNIYPKQNWYHAVITRNNNNNGTWTNILYINGILDNSVNNNFAGSGGSGLLSLGVAINCTTIGYWIGEIATSKIYNRVLTQQEVLQNYNSTKSRYR